mmetsp:Transcript_74195/g.131003  ORF Transcript_74195/g.131003 Transcript_74195/m.131003 type:complete len:221 (-) Transcript_74195:914-1576(-)
MVRSAALAIPSDSSRETTVLAPALAAIIASRPVPAPNCSTTDPGVMAFCSASWYRRAVSVSLASAKPDRLTAWTQPLSLRASRSGTTIGGSNWSAKSPPSSSSSSALASSSSSSDELSSSTSPSHCCPLLFILISSWNLGPAGRGRAKRSVAVHSLFFSSHMPPYTYSVPSCTVSMVLMRGQGPFGRSRADGVLPAFAPGQTSAAGSHWRSPSARTYSSL